MSATRTRVGLAHRTVWRTHVLSGFECRDCGEQGEFSSASEFDADSAIDGIDHQHRCPERAS